jgi:hypothetical protein
MSRSDIMAHSLGTPEGHISCPVSAVPRLFSPLRTELLTTFTPVFQSILCELKLPPRRLLALLREELQCQEHLPVPSFWGEEDSETLVGTVRDHFVEVAA